MSVSIDENDVSLNGAKYPVKAFRQAADLAALKALTGMGDGEIALVPGVALYYYDVSSAATANDITIIDPDTDPGQWLLTGSAAANIAYASRALRQAATAAALRAITGMVDGDAYWIPAVGLFVFDDDNTLTDDGFYIIEPSVGSGAWIKEGFQYSLNMDFVWNPGNLVDGAGETASSFTVTGAEVGDYVLVAPGVDTQGMLVFGWVSAADTVKVRLQNETGGAIDLASSTWRVRVIKQSSAATAP